MSYLPWIAGGAALGYAARRGAGRRAYTDYHGMMHRGLVVEAKSASDAAELRRIFKYKTRPGDRDSKWATAYIVRELMENRAGTHWTSSWEVAEDFARLREATGRGKKFHLILTAEAKQVEKVAYDPTTRGEEFPMMEYEAENRLPPGFPIRLDQIRVIYGPSGHYGGHPQSLLFPDWKLKA